MALHELKNKLGRLRVRLSRWCLLWQIEKARIKTWGRQPEGMVLMPATETQSGMATRMKVKTSIRIRVWREATQQWEDYGEVASDEKTISQEEYRRLVEGSK